MRQLTPQAAAPQTASFPSDFEQAMQGLRGALTELLASLGDDPRLPQVLSRRYEINKNLAWKVCKIVNSTDAYATAQHVPGFGGVRILLAAFEKAGAPEGVLEGVEEAMRRFEHMVRVHVGDRANLDLYLGAIQPEGIHSPQLEVSRRMAFQGNSAVWGVQARVDLTLRLIAPHREDPGRADVCSIGGLLGLRRLRPTASWPVMQQQFFTDRVEAGGEAPIPLDPESPPDGPPLVREFCSVPLPETRSFAEGHVTTHEVSEGSVGNTAAVDCIFGTIERALVPVHAAEEDSVGEHYCRVTTPVEIAQFDLLVHRDLPFEMPPKLITYSMLHGELHFPLSRATRSHLPSAGTVQELGHEPPVLASPHIPRYTRLAELACERMGRSLDEFLGYRMTLSSPPIPVVFVMHHPLARE
jgi:hypothetical protein